MSSSPRGLWFSRAAAALSAVPRGSAAAEVELLPLVHAARVLGDGESPVVE